MGRPSKYKELLSDSYSFKLTKSEAAPLNEKIALSGMRRADFLRDVVLKNKTLVVAKPAASLEKRRMQFLFNKTSNNMNQIAHVLNGASLAGKLSSPLCESAIAQLEAIAKYLRAALHHVD
ncbi:MAG: plasmid mobilization relaxosome protein MobC [Burkholderiaceae bacterium]|nr:plasmid mobilization relaxosome protein MobC [Burkholderiaceae bacterium]